MAARLWRSANNEFNNDSCAGLRGGNGSLTRLSL